MCWGRKVRLATDRPRKMDRNGHHEWGVRSVQRLSGEAQDVCCGVIPGVELYGRGVVAITFRALRLEGPHTRYTIPVSA
jgi:hypothetical protein